MKTSRKVILVSSNIPRHLLEEYIMMRDEGLGYNV